MIIESFDWDEINIEHIAKHQVTADEVEEVFEGKFFFWKVEGTRRCALGKTIPGRYLMVAFDYNQHLHEVRVATARDMNRAERKRYRKVRKP